MCKVSVVVPVYKVEKYLKKCIDSIINQTLQDIEVILIDDGSPDNCGSICDEYKNSANVMGVLVKVIHKENEGVSAARNDGLKKASGEWIIFCDSDDYMEPNALQTLYEKGNEEQADVVFGDVNLVYEDGRTKTVAFYKNEFTTEDNDTISSLIKADFSRGYCFDPPKEGAAFGYGGPWNKLVKRNLLVDNGIVFDTKLKGIFDDILYTAYLFANAKKVSYVHTVVYDYRQLTTSITKTYKENLPEINSAIFVAWNSFMQTYDMCQDYLQPYYAVVIRRLAGLFGLYFFNPQNVKPLEEQFEEIKEILALSPYRDAIREADVKKLHGKKDKIYIRVAKLNSLFAFYLTFKLSQIAKKF